ncbi:hypothetical protein C0214_13880 [Methylobacterium sp. DM1]|nr:hypothetical protein C0214_13880 [Methylobacterium sp. DM1]
MNIKQELRVGSRYGTANTDLADLAHISVTCEDCGRQNWWARAQLDEAEQGGVQSLGALGRKLRCTYCAERGGSGRNLGLRATLREEADHVRE